MYILDTNIVIYLLSGQPTVIEQLQALKQADFSVSVITHFELLVGAKGDHQTEQTLEAYLTAFSFLPVTPMVSRQAIMLKNSNTKQLKFKDLLIAGTAMAQQKILVTADKDFLNIEGLAVELVVL